MSDDEQDGEVHVDKASLEYQRQFDLPADELLVDSFVCALQKGILHQGRLYVSQHYLCFYSNILLSEARLIIRADRIESAALAKVLIFPTAIRIVHSGGVDSLFASFLSRDKAFAVITQISQGRQIGSQRVKTARELDKSADKSPAPPLHTPTFMTKPDKHQQLLEGGRARKSKEGDSSPPKAHTSSAANKPPADVQAQLAKFQKPPRRRDPHEEDDDDADSDTPAAAAPSTSAPSTLDRISSMLTSVHVSQPPRASSNTISTAHGVVVVADPRTVPHGVKFKHVRTGSLALGALDGPGVALASEGGAADGRPSGSPGFKPMGRVSNGGSAITIDGSANVGARDRDRARSANASPMPPAATPARSSHSHSRAKASADPSSDDEDVSSAVSRPVPVSRAKSAAKQVALAMKPRAGGKNAAAARRSRKEESDEEED